MPADTRTRFLTRQLLILAALCFAAGACGPAPVDAPSTESPSTDHGVRLGVADRANEFVSLAAEGRYVAAAWAAIDQTRFMDVYVAMSDDGGTTFGPAVRVNHLPGDARANGEQPPRVALIAQPDGPPHVVAFWLSRRSSGSVLLTSRSIDGGRRFSEAVTVPGTDTAGARGWHTMSAGSDGRVSLAWLDHRRMETGAGTDGDHRHHRLSTADAPDTIDTVAMAQQSDLYFADDLAGSPPKAVTAGVCYCCKTAMVHGRDGAIHLAWRHVFPGNMRDIAFATSRDDGRTFSAPVRVSEDRWSIAGCPDDGPAMAVDGAGRVHVVWPTAVTASDGTMQKRLFHAMTTDGATFTPRVAIPHDDAAHHPQVAGIGDSEIIVVWDGFVGDAQRVFRARGVLDATGAMQFVTMREAPPSGRYPTVVATQTHTITAWTTGQAPSSTIRLAVERLR